MRIAILLNFSKALFTIFYIIPTFPLDDIPTKCYILSGGDG